MSIICQKFLSLEYFTFRKNSKQLHIYVHADAAQKYELLWVRRNGEYMRQ